MGVRHPLAYGWDSAGFSDSFTDADIVLTDEYTSVDV